jgi:Spy/CpxP family protein refolding chaperone
MKLFNRYTVLAFLAGAGLTVGVGVLAAQGMGMMSHGMMMNSSATPAEVSAHVDHMLKHLYVEIDATPAQQAQIGPLVQQAVTDLLPLRSQLSTQHNQFITALTQTTVDRNSLEAAREAHLQLADQASKRIVQLLGDVGNVLTPTQRQALANHLQQLHGASGPGAAAGAAAAPQS